MEAFAQEQSRAGAGEEPPACAGSEHSLGLVTQRSAGASSVRREPRGMGSTRSAGTLAPGLGKLWKFLPTASLTVNSLTPLCESNRLKTSVSHAEALQRMRELWNSAVNVHAPLFKQTHSQMLVSVPQVASSR